MRRTGALFCLASAAGFGAMGVFGKLAYEAGATVATLLAVRFLIAAALLWVAVLASGVPAWRASRRTQQPTRSSSPKRRSTGSTTLNPPPAHATTTPTWRPSTAETGPRQHNRVGRESGSAWDETRRRAPDPFRVSRSSETAEKVDLADRDPVDAESRQICLGRRSHARRTTAWTSPRNGPPDPVRAGTV